MYRITAISNETDTEEEDDIKVTKEAEVCIAITSINITNSSGNLRIIYHNFHIYHSIYGINSL